MGDRFWRGGTASWDGTAGSKWASTVGGAGGAAVPTTADDVYLDATSGSGTVTITTGVGFRSLNCTGFTGTLVINVGLFIVIGNGTAGAGNVAIKLVPGMTFTCPAGSGTVFSFNLSSTTQTITMAGKTIGNTLAELRFTAGSVQLQDSLTVSGAASVITHTGGTLDLNGQAVTIGKFASTGAVARTLTLGSSALTLNATTQSPWTVSGSNLTITSNTATVNCAAVTTGAVAFGGVNYNGTSFTLGLGGSSIITPVTGAGTTVANLTVTGTGDTVVSVPSSLTATGTFTVTGASNANRVLVTGASAAEATGFWYPTGATTATITAATVSLTNCDFADVTGAGAATWSGTTVGNCGGNSGITFTTPRTLYARVAGNLAASTVWNTVDAGSGGSAPPLPQDAVYFTANAGAGTYTNNLSRWGTNVDFTGFTRTMNFTTNHWWTFGNLTMASGATYSMSKSVHCCGRGAHTVTMAGKSWAAGTGGVVYMSGPGGTYTQGDAFTTTSTFELLAGGWATANYAFTCSTFGQTPSTLTQSFTAGTSTITATATSGTVLTLATAGLTWSAASSTFVLSAASTSTRTFAGGGYTHGTLTYTVAGSTGQLTVTGANTFTGINFSDTTNARTLILPASTTTAITTDTGWAVNGTAGKLMTVNSSSSGTAATLSVPSGTVSADYLSLRDITATGGAVFYAGANSTNTSNNTGWIFTAPSTFVPIVVVVT